MDFLFKNLQIFDKATFHEWAKPVHETGPFVKPVFEDKCQTDSFLKYHYDFIFCPFLNEFLDFLFKNIQIFDKATFHEWAKRVHETGPFVKPVFGDKCQRDSFLKYNYDCFLLIIARIFRFSILKHCNI